MCLLVRSWLLIDLDRINRIICAHYIQLVASVFLFQLFAIFSHLHQSSLPLLHYAWPAHHPNLIRQSSASSSSLLDCCLQQEFNVCPLYRKGLSSWRGFQRKKGEALAGSGHVMCVSFLLGVGVSTGSIELDDMSCFRV